MPAGEPPPAGVLMQLIVQVLAPKKESNKFWLKRWSAPLLSMAAKSTLRMYSMGYSSRHYLGYVLSSLRSDYLNRLLLYQVKPPCILNTRELSIAPERRPAGAGEQRGCG